MGGGRSPLVHSLIEGEKMMSEEFWTGFVLGRWEGLIEALKHYLKDVEDDFVKDLLLTQEDLYDVFHSLPKKVNDKNE